MFYRQTTFREIKQIRAYDLENLYGNIGGYMGLFLGYAILNLPTMFLFFYGSLKKNLLAMRTPKTHPHQNKANEGFLRNNLFMMLGTTTIMMNTIDERNTGDHNREKNEDKYETSIIKLEERLRSIEERMN